MDTIGYTEEWTTAKCAVMWTGIILFFLSLMVPITLMVNSHSHSETEQVNACIAEHGTYLDGSCTWPTEGSQ